ncbi:MAG: DUF262 domain-containing protein [Candidatus Sulfotelmatobacter sp.]
MQQRFNTRNYSIRDFEEWEERDELVLAPKFQRRDVWSDKARSYLMDTILRGKPIPKIYMRQDVNPKTRRTKREIVDGQQRLRTVLSFIKDGFKISRAHHETFGGKVFSALDKETQRDILKYEFVVDLLQDMPDNEVYDLFARINTYSEKLKAQELRNAKYFGEFKSSVYLLAKEFVTFFEINKVFSPKLILRMAEAEFISELLLAEHEGIREGSKATIDSCYKNYEDNFPGRKGHEKRFRETIDTIGGILGADLPQLKFRATRLFYPLFCAVFHMKFGLPRLAVARSSLKVADYPKLKNALESVDELVERIEAARKANEEIVLSADDRKFYDAYSEHWVHAEERSVLTQYICKQLTQTLKS